MEEDLALQGSRYSWLITIFYISYAVFQFQILLWKVFTPHRWAAFAVLGWYVFLFESGSYNESSNRWQGHRRNVSSCCPDLEW